MSGDLDFGGLDRYEPGEYDGDDRCLSCGAEIDHYLGCPEDPSPDYEANAQAQRDLLAQAGGGPDEAQDVADLLDGDTNE